MNLIKMLSCTEIPYKGINVKKFVPTYVDPDWVKRPIIRTSEDSYKIFKPLLNDIIQHHEELWILYLGHENRALGVACISVGASNHTVVDISIIFQVALLVNAKHIIIAHNHTGGVYPSEHDHTHTERIYKAGEILGISLYDSIILNYTKYYSFADDGLIQQLKTKK